MNTVKKLHLSVLFAGALCAAAASVHAQTANDTATVVAVSAATAAPAASAATAAPAASATPATPADSSALDNAVSGFIQGFAQTHPVVATILGLLGALGTILPGLSDLVHKFILATPTDKDDKLEAAVESSTAWKWASYAFTYLFRVAGISLKPGA